MSTSEAKPISAAQLEEMEAQRKEEAAAAVQKVEAAEEAAVASALNQLFDQPRDPSAPPGMLGATTVKTETGPVKVAAFSPEALARAGGVARVGSGRNGEESAAELEVSSDLLAEAAASSGISGPILLSMGSLNDQAVANLKTDHPLAQGRRLASALKSQAVSINFRDETGKKISVKNLQTPMKIILKVQDASARCAYWDEVNSQWSEEGVTTSDEVAPESSIICLTTHLSLFGGVVNAVVRNVALALECSTLSSVMDDAAFQKLFDGEWLAKPQSVVSILFMIISIASVLVALRCDHQSEQLLPSQDREEMLMRVKAGQSEEEEAGAEPEASLQQTLFQQVRSAAEQVLDFLAQASGGNGFLEAVKEGVANAQTAAVNRGLSTLQAFRSRTDQASMNIVHLHGESQKDPPSDVQHANMAIPRLDAHNMASRSLEAGCCQPITKSPSGSSFGSSDRSCEADQDGDLSLESFEDLSAKEIAPPRPTTLPPCSNHPTPPTQRAPSAYSEMEVEPMRFSRPRASIQEGFRQMRQSIQMVIQNLTHADALYEKVSKDRRGAAQEYLQRGWLRRVLLLLPAGHAWLKIQRFSIVLPYSVRVALICMKLISCGFLSALFFASAAPAPDADPDCAPPSDEFAKLVQTATVGIVSAVLGDGLILVLFFTRKLRVVERPLWTEEMKSRQRCWWRVRSIVFWVVAVAYSSFCQLYICLFLATVRDADAQQWLESVGVSLLQDLLLKPFLFALIVASMSTIVLACNARVRRKLEAQWLEEENKVQDFRDSLRSIRSSRKQVKKQAKEAKNQEAAEFSVVLPGMPSSY